MNQYILHIEFLLGTKKRKFNLNLISHFATESGGQPWTNQYDLVVDNNFYEFWDYVRNRYAVDSRELIRKPTKARVEQKTKGINNRGYPWTSSLLVSDEIQSENTIFHPHICDLLSEVEKEEYVEFVKADTKFTNE